MPTNLSLLARIARGEHTFRVGPLALPEEAADFHQLVCDVRRLAVAGYVSGVRRSGEWRRPDELALDVEAPGITPAGIAALRQAGYIAPGVADAGRGRRGDE